MITSVTKLWAPDLNYYCPVYSTKFSDINTCKKRKIFLRNKRYQLDDPYYPYILERDKQCLVCTGPIIIKTNRGKTTYGY